MLGRPKQAAKLYRIVASAEDEEYWKSRALWWLDYLTRAEQMKKRQTQLESQMNALRKEVDEFKAK